MIKVTTSFWRKMSFSMMILPISTNEMTHFLQKSLPIFNSEFCNRLNHKSSVKYCAQLPWGVRLARPLFCMDFEKYNVAGAHHLFGRHYVVVLHANVASLGTIWLFSKATSGRDERKSARSWEVGIITFDLCHSQRQHLWDQHLQDQHKLLHHHHLEEAEARPC